MSGLISEARTEGAHFHTSHSVLHFLILLYLENLLLYFSFFKLGIGLIRFNTVQEQLGATQRGVSELKILIRRKKSINQWERWHIILDNNYDWQDRVHFHRSDWHQGLPKPGIQNKVNAWLITTCQGWYHFFFDGVKVSFQGRYSSSHCSWHSNRYIHLHNLCFQLPTFSLLHLNYFIPEAWAYEANSLILRFHVYTIQHTHTHTPRVVNCGCRCSADNIPLIKEWGWFMVDRQGFGFSCEQHNDTIRKRWTLAVWMGCISSKLVHFSYSMQTGPFKRIISLKYNVVRRHPPWLKSSHCERRVSDCVAFVAVFSILEGLR